MGYTTSLKIMSDVSCLSWSNCLKREPTLIENYKTITCHFWSNESLIYTLFYITLNKNQSFINPKKRYKFQNKKYINIKCGYI